MQSGEARSGRLRKEASLRYGQQDWRFLSCVNGVILLSTDRNESHFLKAEWIENGMCMSAEFCKKRSRILPGPQGWEINNACSDRWTHIFRSYLLVSVCGHVWNLCPDAGPTCMLRSSTKMAEKWRRKRNTLSASCSQEMGECCLQVGSTCPSTESFVLGFTQFLLTV